jgi:hypothetical protein
MRLAVAVALTALSSAALAQNTLPEPTKVQCYSAPLQSGGSNETRALLDMPSTQAFRIDAAKRDAQVMADFTGLWYSEFASPNGDSTTQIYYSFEPNGLFQYQSQTCWGMCSPGYGTGQWVGLKEADGQVRVIYNWSDLERTSACSGNTGKLDGDTFNSQLGGTWTRVQRFEANDMPVDPGLAPPRPAVGQAFATPPTAP